MPAEKKEKKEKQTKHVQCYVDTTKKITIDEVDEGGLTWGRVPFVLSKEVIDRSGEVVKISGIDISDYKKNPVVLWMHRLGWWKDNSEEDVIGKIDPDTLKKIGNELVGDVLFNLTKESDFGLAEEELEQDANILNTVFQEPRAVRIFRKLQSGLLKAGSIGFRTIERTSKAILEGQKGSTLLKTLLMEFSICILGDNPDALAKELQDSSDIQRKEFFEDMAELMTPEDIKAFDEILQEKVGAELSKKNKKAIQTCRDQAKKMHDDLNIVLKEDGNDGKSVDAVDFFEEIQHKIPDNELAELIESSRNETANGEGNENFIKLVNYGMDFLEKALGEKDKTEPDKPTRTYKIVDVN